MAVIGKDAERYFKAAEGKTSRLDFAATSPAVLLEKAKDETAENKRWTDGQVRRAISGDDPQAAALFQNVSPTGNDKEARKKTEKEKDEWFREALQLQQQMLENIRALEQYTEELNEITAVLRLRIAENKTIIGENDRWLEDMKRTHKGADSAIAFYEENGHFERDKDGTLKNKDAQKILDEYIKRTGKKPESDTAIAYALQEQKRIDFAEAEQRRIKNEQLKKQVTGDETQLSTAETEFERIKKRIEEIRNSGHSPEEQAREMAELRQSIKDHNVLRDIKEYYKDDPEIVHEAVKEKANLRNTELSTEEDDDTADLAQLSGKFNQFAENKPADTPLPTPDLPENRALPKNSL